MLSRCLEWEHRPLQSAPVNQLGPESSFTSSLTEISPPRSTPRQSLSQSYGQAHSMYKCSKFLLDSNGLESGGGEFPLPP